MNIKIISIIILVSGYVLILLSTNYGLKKAKLVHNAALKDVKNEIKSGYVIRSLCSLLYFLSIIYWIFDFFCSFGFSRSFGGSTSHRNGL